MLLRDNIYDAIRADILACRLPPGEALREQDLAAQFAVSRAPVRDALLRLQQDRLVTVHPRQGYSVNQVSVSDARNLFEFRLIMETACCSAAAERATSDMLDGLERFRHFAPDDDFIRYNRAFHAAVAHASCNIRMADAVCDLIDQAERLVRVSLANVKGRNPAQLVAEHGELIDAIQNRDARGAARLMREHIQKAERRIMTALTRSAVTT